MSGKNFLTIVTASFLIIVILFGSFNYFFYKAPQSTLWINKCFEKKDKYANSIVGKKIVFTSGSNTLYGMETNIIENTLRIPTVNMAIHAGLKTDYILYRAKQILNKGDIIIVPFEYENIIWNGEESPVRTEYILTYDKNFFNKNLTFFDKISMLYSLSPTDFFKSIQEQIRAPKEAQIGRGYTSETLNKNGDETYKNGTLDSIKHSNHQIFKATQFYETKGLKIIKEFSEWCKENDIKMYMTYPNIIKSDLFTSDDYIRYFKSLEEYYKINDIKVIGSPSDAIFSIEHFYDTRYHMNKNGAKIRTFKFLQILEKEYLKDFGILVTKENIEEHLQNLKEQIKAYDPNSIMHP